MKKLKYLIIGATLLTAGCTKNFNDYNKDPYGFTELNMPQGANDLMALQRLVIPEQENSYQMCFDLGPTGYAGYATQFPNFIKDYPIYSPRTSWLNYIFDDTYPKIYTPFFSLSSVTKSDIAKFNFAWGVVLRVAITDWMTDIYGPLPYSQMNPGQLQTPYDAQDVLYKNMCEDLKKAITTLKAVDPFNRQYKDYDLVYGGDMSKWAKYASSLLLRLSIRMAKQAPAEAQQYAEFAVQSGVITSREDDAQMATLDNPVFKMSATWGNSGVNAEITEYMNAFNDPRRSAYFTPVASRTAGKQFFGIRNGNPNVNYAMSDYSLPNITKTSPIVWMSTAEVDFLRAEGALNGWNMSGTPGDLYKQGVQASFDQWNAGDATAYLTNTSQRGALVDEKNPGFNTAFNSNITVNWDNGGTSKENQLSKIITQKWIAMFPYGAQEAWAEWRRTGYPNMLPPTVNNSGGTVANITQISGRDHGGMQRLPYSTTETTNNAVNLKAAISMLGGADNGGTQLWWAK
ncbi:MULTISPECIES: SusD/RagB family nutrient-binding outer membrane lipoprotein [Chitinophagaceae]